MNDVITIPKWDGSSEMKPPYWVNTFNSQGEQIRPHIRCQCGEHTNIGNHHIHVDGSITASYYHYFADRPEKMQGCKWHVFLKMLDWDGGELKPGEDKVKI